MGAARGWRWAAAVLALAAAWAGPGATAAASRYRVSDSPSPEWRNGPVRYIITKSEDDEYRQIDSEEGRQSFIEAFWRRRDPTPDTPGNEYRGEFWKRVRDATRLYGRETTRPGWMTDMGKAHILFGPPDDIARDEVAQGRRGIIVWTYRNSPAIGGYSTNAGPNTVLAFAQDGTGEYRLTAEPSKVADVWEGLAKPQPAFGPYKFFEERRRAFQEAYARYIGITDPVIRQAGGPPMESPLSLTMSLARIHQPPREWVLRGDVTTREFFGSLPFRARADFFKSSDRLTHVVLDVAVRSSTVTYRTGSSGRDEPAVRVYARILDSTTTNLVASLEGETDFSPAAENASALLDDDLVFQARTALPPGTYVARLTVLDEASGRTGTSDTPFTVPDFASAALEISSVALARSLDPAPEDARPTWPYVLGRLRVVPRLGQDFRPQENLAFYFQVYNAGKDPATAAPLLDLRYIFLAGGEEEAQEIGRAAFSGQTVESHGYAIPLTGFPPGNYLLRIEVDDRVTGAQARRDVLFRVQGAP